MRERERERINEGEGARRSLVGLLKYNGVIRRESVERTKGGGVSFKREVFLSVLN